MHANRLNAQKSTWPKTPEGKLASSRNATTHGLTSQVPILPGEDELEYQTFAAEVLADLAPVGIVQHEVARGIVSIMWKLRRVPGIERELVRMDIERTERYQRKCEVCEKVVAYEMSEAFLILLELANLLIYHIVFIEGNIPSPNDRIHLRNPHAILVDAVIANKPSND